MGGDLNVKADINVVDAPTAQNVVMDAPDPFAEPVAPVTEPGTVAFEPQADVFEADPVTEVLPPAETGIPAADVLRSNQAACGRRTVFSCSALRAGQAG